jgi:hypothetical protein
MERPRSSWCSDLKLLFSRNASNRSRSVWKWRNQENKEVESRFQTTTIVERTDAVDPAGLTPFHGIASSDPARQLILTIMRQRVALRGYVLA